MGTRGIVGFRKNNEDKFTYNHLDSYPDYLGRKMAQFCANHTVEELDRIYDSLVLVDETCKPTAEQVAECVAAGYCDMNDGKPDAENWYCLLEEIQGEPEYYAKAAKKGMKNYMTNYNDFILDSDCEYAYVINLDSKKLEFWVGNQRKPQRGNRYGCKKYEWDSFPPYWYPCMLAAEFSLEPSFDAEAAVARMLEIYEED